MLGKLAMRLDQFVSQASGISRSETSKLIRAGRVSVNGVVLRKASTHIDPTAQVLFDEEVLSLPGAIYLALHRERVGEWELDATLQPGEWRVL